MNLRGHVTSGYRDYAFLGEELYGLNWFIGSLLDRFGFNSV